MKALVGSRDAAWNETLRGALTGIEVIGVDSGAELLEAVRAPGLAGIVLGHLDDVDPLRLLALLKSSTRTAAIPVVVVAPEASRIRALVNGAEAVVEPGLPPPKVAERARAAFERRREADAPMLPNQFKSVRLLGTGGLADAYHAFDEKLGRAVILKVLREPKLGSTKGVEALFPELKLGNKHPGVINLLKDVKTLKGEKVLVLEPPRGEPLGTALGKVPRGKVADALADTVEFLRRHRLEPGVISPDAVRVDKLGRVQIDVGLLSAPRDVEVKPEIGLQFLGLDTDAIMSRLREKLTPTTADSRPQPTDDAFQWNTRFPGTAPGARPALTVGSSVDVETAIELTAGAAATKRIPKKDLPAGTRIAFEVRANGATLVAGGASGWIIRSESLEVGPAGTAPFRFKLVPNAAAVRLRLDVCKGIALVASQNVDLEAAPPETGVAGSPATAAPPVVAPAPFSLHAIESDSEMTRVDLELRDGKFWVRVGTDLLPGKYVEAATHAEELANAAKRARLRLVDATDAFSLDHDASKAMTCIREVGAELHKELFGDPIKSRRSEELWRAARTIAEARSAGGRLHIVAELLPFPWAILNDEADFDRLETKAPAKPWEHFWGGRFQIDRAAGGMSQHARSVVLGPERIRVRTFLNKHIDQQQNVQVSDRQRNIVKEIHSRRPAVEAVDRVIEKGDDFKAWLRKPDACEMLYFFCHASVPEPPNNPSFPPPPLETRATLNLDESDYEAVDVATMHRHDGALPGEPFVFLNACSSAQGDPSFQSLFVTLFVGSWHARGFLGADWKVPTVFADEFSRDVLHRFLEKQQPIADALWEAGQEQLAAGNPFPLIYALYAQPGLRAGR